MQRLIAELKGDKARKEFTDSDFDTDLEDETRKPLFM